MTQDDDITQRLRWCTVHGSQTDAMAAMIDAAKEIELLRARVEVLRDIVLTFSKDDTDDHSQS